jgi:hypothetical protein
MAKDDDFNEFLIALIRQVGGAVVDHLEAELQGQLSRKLASPNLPERHETALRVRQAFDDESLRLNAAAKAELEPLLERALELADSEEFVAELSRRLQSGGLNAFQRLILLNGLAPDSNVEIRLFEDTMQPPQAPGLRLVKEEEEPEP